MNITTECDITPSVAAALRKSLGLTQREFWGAVGSSQESGHWFETGRRKGIPKPIRILIFLRYIAKVDFDVSTPDSAAVAVRAGMALAAQRAKDEAEEAARRAKDLARKAKLMPA
ncbi:hypothetical protein [Burkholderia multivorans]|uniref:hypothetical protein n=1 Tax=Burkholderia multivorans TaxID=87883 RepID=UPI001C22CD9E|nr:hypothetical protein [Burkholderia multivorans]MBU9386595.1 hypothetical protein [Burkholderia multivorans]MBU9437028.1 hypothetical protein [Burkholderia multivorans]MBU9606235.1 hypothetical protein [Burkholderia multivorans]MBU9624794.1 hypothetical protein [Burkholderia multivorans]MDN7510938.1 hypothetical protein [Burkholderia multivorans]